MPLPEFPSVEELVQHHVPEFRNDHSPGVTMSQLELDGLNYAITHLVTQLTCGARRIFEGQKLYIQFHLSSDIGHKVVLALCAIAQSKGYVIQQEQAVQQLDGRTEYLFAVYI